MKNAIDVASLPKGGPYSHANVSEDLVFAAGVIDVKSPFVETPETVNLKLHNVSDIDDIGPERVLGGTDCGFETFSGLGSVPKSIALQKLKLAALPNPEGYNSYVSPVTLPHWVDGSKI